MALAWQINDHVRDETIAARQYNKQRLLATKLSSPFEFSASCTADRLHMACSPLYAKSIKRITLTDDSRKHLSLFSGTRFPNLNQLTYEHTWSSPEQFFGMVRLIQSVVEHALNTSSLTLSLLFRSPKIPIPTHEYDWQYGRATVIAVDNLIKLLNSEHTLHIRLQFFQDDVPIPACATQFFTDLIGLVVKRNRPQDRLYFERAPEACSLLLAQHVMQTGLSPLRFQLSILSTVAPALQIIANMPHESLLDLTLSVVEAQRDHQKTSGPKLWKHLMNLLPDVLRTSAMLTVMCPNATDAFERDLQPDIDFDFVEDWGQSKCSATIVDWPISQSSTSYACGCACVVSVNDLCEVPMLSLRDRAAEELMAAMAAGNFTSDKIRCLHISTDYDDWEEPNDYAMIRAALPNLVEYVLTETDSHRGYGFYKYTEAFNTSYYGYLCIGRQQLAAATLAIDLAGLELSQELLHKVLLPAVLRVMRRSVLAD
eukprot:TRINITY_DN11416_c4_g7_i1.p1 TRINITY_DN11416_c4_g7~~TRINITY_DN11416_c4_g7_i1.p1  ORF type:complete len:484 (+),score=41.13 TRINITY_DN11416_c4_g7_i1:170-1621(+)